MSPTTSDIYAVCTITRVCTWGEAWTFCPSPASSSVAALAAGDVGAAAGAAVDAAGGASDRPAPATLGVMESSASPREMNWTSDGAANSSDSSAPPQPATITTLKIINRTTHARNKRLILPPSPQQMGNLADYTTQVSTQFCLLSSSFMSIIYRLLNPLLLTDMIIPDS